MRPPTTAQVIPGALVNIVLKADQPTGRTVSGKIQDVLTRGNHPRGIKVRLVDGRVGRVQSMLSNSSSVPSSSSAPAAADSAVTPSGTAGRGSRGRRSDYDDGSGGGYPPEQQALGLDAYIKPARNQRCGGARGGSARSISTTAGGGDSNANELDGLRQETAGELSVCPVCNDFEGDEAAVAHHVAGHFGD
ncbi:DUF2196 domain containing protein [Naviculisporaceae sp. PSN 640]